MLNLLHCTKRPNSKSWNSLETNVLQIVSGQGTSMQVPGKTRFRLVSGVSKDKGTSRVPVSRSCDKCVLDPETIGILQPYYLFPVPETGILLESIIRFKFIDPRTWPLGHKVGLWNHFVSICLSEVIKSELSLHCILETSKSRDLLLMAQILPRVQRQVSFEFGP